MRTLRLYGGLRSDLCSLGCPDRIPYLQNENDTVVGSRFASIFPGMPESDAVATLYASSSLLRKFRPAPRLPPEFDALSLSAAAATTGGQWVYKRGQIGGQFDATL